MIHGRLVLAACTLVGCLPVREVATNHDIPIDTFTVDKDPSAPSLIAEVDTSDTTLTLTLARVTACTKETHAHVRRRREIVRSTPHSLHIPMYVLSLAATAFGAVLLYDNLATDDPATRRFAVGSTLETGRYVGLGTMGAGALLLLVSLGNSARAADEHQLHPEVDVLQESQPRPDCTREPAAGELVGLVFSVGANEHAYVELGKSDARGRVGITWSTLATKVPATAAPEGSVVVGTRTEIEAALARRQPPSALATVVMRTVTSPEEAWAAAQAADTPEAYRAFRLRYASSPFAGEAASRERARTAAQAFDAALARGDTDAVARALEDLRDIDPNAAAGLQHKLDSLAKTQRQRRVTEALAAFETSADPAAALASARSAIETLRAHDPELATRAQTELEELRGRITTRVVAEGEDAAARGDLRRAAERFGVAVTIAKDVKSVTKARTAALDRAVRTMLASARALARQHAYADAIAIVDQILSVAPSTKAAAVDRARWAQLAAERERRQQREAAEAERKQREREAREAARAAKAEQQRLAAEKRARAAAEQKQREEARKLALEAERKARAEAAEQKRRAAEAERAARADRKRAEAEAKRKREEEERRRIAAAKLEAQVTRATRPKTWTVQFRLPSRHARDSVLERLPVPPSCRATSKKFFAKPTECPTCPPRAMSSVDMTCGELHFAFVRDQRTVWLSCSGTRETACDACLAAGKSALAPFIAQRERLSVTQGCPKR